MSLPTPPERVGLLVFDMDGVLVDVSASFHLAIIRTVAELGGGTVAMSDIQALKNEGGYNNDWDLSREMLRRRGVAVERARVIEVFNRFYLGPRGNGEGGLILEERWLLPAERLAALRRRYRLAIFTGRPRADALFTLRHYGVADAFEALVGLEDVPQQKPHPAGLEQLRAQYAPEPIAAYVGDTVDDARCAAAVGVPFIAILPAEQPHHADLEALFHATGCRHLVPDVAAAAAALL